MVPIPARANSGTSPVHRAAASTNPREIVM